MPTTSTPSTELESIKADLIALRDDVSSLSRSLLSSGAESAKAARDVVERTVQQATQSAEHAVRDRPFTSLLLAFGIGAALGAAICRR
jgi:ElaB/YqjD/DUF883 family membrane-anchored ribosome-binding protein